MFEGQCVGGDVFGVQVKDAFDGGLPGGKRLFGQAVDQVKVEIVEACFSGSGHCFDDGEEIVDAFEHAQFFGVGRLDAIADAVDACFADAHLIFAGEIVPGLASMVISASAVNVKVARMLGEWNQIEARKEAREFRRRRKPCAH